MDGYVWPDAKGETAELLRAYDGSRLGLGPPAAWPQSLRTTLDIILNAPTAMLLLYGPDRLQFYNDAYRDILGDRHPAAFGMSSAESAPQSWPRTREVMDAVFRGETAVARESVGPHDRWMETRYSPLRDEAGTIVAALAVVIPRGDQDVIDDADRRLAAESTFMRGLFQNAPSLLVVTHGPTHVIEMANASFMQLVDQRAIVGRPAYAALPELAGQGCFEYLDKAYETGERLVVRNHRVVFNRDADVREEHFLASVYQPIIGADGQVRGIFFQAIDVTEEKRARDALATMNETLEVEVAKRTMELRQKDEALRQSQKMEAIGQLTGGIAHDFNNMLQSIVGSLEVIERKLSDGQMAGIDRWVTGAIASANRAAALTHRLLAFSRRQPLDPKLLDVNALVESLRDLMRQTLGVSIALDFRLAPDLWPTKCDAHQLENSILNLVINARDAMPNGGTVTVATSNSQIDAMAGKGRDAMLAQFVCIAVSDTGTGMAQDVIDRAFEPFFTTKPTGQGTGLGLSMIYGFARQSAGYAKIESVLGKGSTVRIFLPRFDGPVEAEPPPGQPMGQARDGEIVLVVEDEPVVRRLIVEVLDDLGYRALEAGDGPSALHMLESQARIDLLITDIGLPGLNGRQVADAARIARPGLKILLMTGYAETATRADGFLQPGMQLMTKPFTIEALASRIREMIAIQASV